MLDYAFARARMVERQLARRGVQDERVLAAMGETPREAFVPVGMEEFAYDDSPLPIEAGQTISQPYIVGLMIEAAGLKPGEKVLEVGAGSGYAAAVMSRIADRVYAIERHEDLTRRAEHRLRRLGFENIELRTGDGTQGWPEAAPFEAIVVAAVGPQVPEPLKAQLSVGGRLVISVGDAAKGQRLMKLTRTETGFDETDLGLVTFVPLVGEHGWTEPGVARPPEPRSFRGIETSLPQLIRRAAEPLPEPEQAGFAEAFDRFASAKVVLLGEASHGTSEFYRARAAITRRLIEKHGFRIVAVEADWPDAAHLDRYVRDRPPPARDEPPFRRFPTWMWRNNEVDRFIQGLRDWNLAQSSQDRAGFYGLDLYNLSASIRGVLDYLDRVDPEAAGVARTRYGCLSPWARSPQVYGRMALTEGYHACEAGVVATLQEMLEKRLQYAARDGDKFLEAAGDARLVKNAEAYYRAMYYSGAESWNLRDTHMFETLCALLEARGPDAKAVVWAHNSHIGDASKTEMGLDRDELNLGQLCRERFGADAALLGFGTHAGRVACASDWDEPMEVRDIQPSLPESYERQAHDAGLERFLLDLRPHVASPVRHALLQPRLERFIGVIYRPETERWSHYAECSLPQQFDGYVWFDETTPVTPLPTAQEPSEDDTWPFGL